MLTVLLDVAHYVLQKISPVNFSNLLMAQLTFILGRLDTTHVTQYQTKVANKKLICLPAGIRTVASFLKTFSLVKYIPTVQAQVIIFYERKIY